MLPTLLHRRHHHSILQPSSAPVVGVRRLVEIEELDPTIDTMVETTWILILCAMSLFETVVLDDKEIVFHTKMMYIVARVILSHHPTLPN
jgi:uncharacterized membrane protein